MARPIVHERALVVRTYDFGEADRVIVLLTRTRGVLRGVAKGVRRQKSRFGSRLQPFVELDVAAYASPSALEGRGLATITGAETRQYFGAGIIEDYERYTAASAVLEAASQLDAGDGDPFLFDAALAALASIQAAAEPTLPLDAFLLQAMAHLGWRPSLFDCAQCGKPGPHRGFNPGAGGAVCEKCRPPGSPLPPSATMQLMWRVAGGYSVEDLRERLGRRDFAEAVVHAHRLTIAYLQWQAERGFTTLNVSDTARTHYTLSP